MLRVQFGVVEEARNAGDRLRTLVQCGSILQYLEVFQATAIQIDNANDAELLHAFVQGLKKKMHAEVRLGNPKTLDKAAYLALDFAKLLHLSCYCVITPLTVVI